MERWVTLLRFSLAGGVLVATLAGTTVAGAEPDARGAVIWREDFKGGRPRAGEWTRCQQPFQTNVGACAASASGPGEQIFWDPELFGGGADPVRPSPEGGIHILAKPITPAERQLVRDVMVRQAVAPQHAGALTRAGWTSGWLQTIQSFGIGSTVRARIRPGAGVSSWSGLWMLNDPSHRRWPPEIDVAEVTNNSDGSMYVRQNLHYRDETGKLKASQCPTTLPQRGWIEAEVARLPNAVRFSLNGKITCTFPLPQGMADQMQIILSQQVGGLAKPTSANTEPFSLDVAWVEVLKN